MLTASALVTLLVAATAPALHVEITSPKTRLAIFEPVKLTVHATANTAVVVPAFSDTAGSPAVETWINYGNGFVRYVDETREMGDGVGGERSLAPGSRLVKTVVLVEGRIGDQPSVPFPAVGRYSLRVLLRARPE